MLICKTMSQAIRNKAFVMINMKHERERYDTEVRHLRRMKGMLAIFRRRKNMQARALTNQPVAVKDFTATLFGDCLLDDIVDSGQCRQYDANLVRNTQWYNLQANTFNERIATLRKSPFYKK